MLPLIDTHCHLDIAAFDADRAEQVSRCQAAGMQAILVPGVTQAGWARLRAVCESLPLLHPAFGLHPCYLAEHESGHLDALEQQLQAGAIAVGEIGLDTFHGDQDLVQQQALFAAQVAIARQHRLPLMLHARKTHDLLLKELRRQRFAEGGVVHAFSGSLQQARHFIEQGFAIGFGGAATYERALKLRAILKALPAEWIVLETDAPDILPSFARDGHNTPFHLFRMAEVLAEVRQMPVQELAAITTGNAARIFRLKPAL